MSKFQVGDVVERLHSNHRKAVKGNLYRVKAMRLEGVVLDVEDHISDYAYTTSSFKLVHSAVPAPSPDDVYMDLCNKLKEKEKNSNG